MKIIVNEIESALSAMKRASTPGLDLLTTEIIQNAGPTLINMLHKILNTALANSKSLQVALQARLPCLSCKNYRRLPLRPNWSFRDR